MSESAQTDEALIAAYRQGDNAALETLLNRCLKPIHLTIRRFSRAAAKDETTLEQLAGEVVVVILEKLQKNRFDPAGPASFKTWVYSVCKNICLTANRKAQHQKPFTTVYQAGQQPDPLGVLDRLGDEAPEYSGQLAQANDVMAKLPPKDQKLLRLRLMENKSYEEIQLDEDFKKYSIDYLMKMMYKINIKINKIKEVLYGKKE